MFGTLRRYAFKWTTLFPVLALLAFLITLGTELPMIGIVIISLLLAGTVLASVHHAEVVAHKVGEPFGSLVLAVAVTVIEVALIVTVMIGGDPEKSATLARDTVFAALMITTNGIVGLCLLTAALRRRVAVFNSEGTGAALATVATLATLGLVFPVFTTSTAGPEFSGPQLAFAAVASLFLYLLFVGMQTMRHRDYFLPITTSGRVVTEEAHAEPPSKAQAIFSLVLLLVALIAVVGDAKAVSPAIETGVATAGMPASIVGVIIAMLVLGPETLAAFRAARRDRTQTSLNLAYGSAMASIGLTIPVIAIASIWLTGPLELGLSANHIVLVALTMIVSIITIVPGRATLLHGGVHLALFASFLFLAISP